MSFAFLSVGYMYGAIIGIFHDLTYAAVFTDSGTSCCHNTWIVINPIQNISFAFVGMGYRAGVCLLFVYVVHGPTYAAVIKDSSGGCCRFAWIIINLRFVLYLGLCLL